MKVKELIQQLQNFNPEAEVVVGGEAIFFAEELPGYYDGYYQKLIQDPRKAPYYNVQGLEFSRTGTKVKLHLLELSDIIWNCESLTELEQLEFKFNNLHPDQEARIKLEIHRIKQELITYLKENK